jgi:hypothetical protein
VSDIVATTCTTSDGLTLEAEVAVADGTARAATVLCHPHPQFGGTMRSIVIGALFDALPPAGVTCLRFNFRGVEGSEGFHDNGRGEQLDVVAAIGTLDAQVDASLPMLLAGWSFGGDLALATVVDRVAGWFAVAPPLRSAPDFSAGARDPRPKLLALAEHDEIRTPASVVEETSTWVATELEVVGGASHYFVGRTDRLVALALPFVDRLTAGN